MGISKFLSISLECTLDSGNIRLPKTTKRVNSRLVILNFDPKASITEAVKSTHEVLARIENLFTQKRVL